MLAVELLRHGRDPLLRERAHGLAQELVLVGEVEVHGYAGEAPRQLGEQADAVAGRAQPGVVVAAAALEVGGAGDVEVGPRALAREGLQEGGGQDRGGLAVVGGVLQVGEGRVVVAVVALVERQAPGVVAARLGGRLDLGAPLLVVPEEARRRGRPWR